MSTWADYLAYLNADRESGQEMPQATEGVPALPVPEIKEWPYSRWSLSRAQRSLTDKLRFLERLPAPLRLFREFFGLKALEPHTDEEMERRYPNLKQFETGDEPMVRRPPLEQPTGEGMRLQEGTDEVQDYERDYATMMEDLFQRFLPTWRRGNFRRGYPKAYQQFDPRDVPVEEIQWGPEGTYFPALRHYEPSYGREDEVVLAQEGEENVPPRPWEKGETMGRDPLAWIFGKESARRMEAQGGWREVLKELAPLVLMGGGKPFGRVSLRPRGLVGGPKEMPGVMPPRPKDLPPLTPEEEAALFKKAGAPMPKEEKPFQYSKPISESAAEYQKEQGITPAEIQRIMDKFSAGNDLEPHEAQMILDAEMQKSDPHPEVLKAMGDILKGKKWAKPPPEESLEDFGPHSLEQRIMEQLKITRQEVQETADHHGISDDDYEDWLRNWAKNPESVTPVEPTVPGPEDFAKPAPPEGEPKESFDVSKLGEEDLWKKTPEAPKPHIEQLEEEAANLLQNHLGENYGEEVSHEEALRQIREYGQNSQGEYEDALFRYINKGDWPPSKGSKPPEAAGGVAPTKPPPKGPPPEEGSGDFAEWYKKTYGEEVPSEEEIQRRLKEQGIDEETMGYTPPTEESLKPTKPPPKYGRWIAPGELGPLPPELDPANHAGTEGWYDPRTGKLLPGNKELLKEYSSKTQDLFNQALKEKASAWEKFQKGEITEQQMLDQWQTASGKYWAGKGPPTETEMTIHDIEAMQPQIPPYLRASPPRDLFPYRPPEAGTSEGEPGAGYPPWWLFARGTKAVPPPTSPDVSTAARGTDTVPAMLTPGEAVLNRHAAELFGRDKIRRLNAIGSWVERMRAFAPVASRLWHPAAARGFQKGEEKVPEPPELPPPAWRKYPPEFFDPGAPSRKQAADQLSKLGMDVEAAEGSGVFEFDGKFYVMPTVMGGQRLDDDDIKNLHRQGIYLGGPFDAEDEASIWERDVLGYVGDVGPQPPPEQEGD
jgi:hypothetical protein